MPNPDMGYISNGGKCDVHRTDISKRVKCSQGLKDNGVKLSLVHGNDMSMEIHVFFFLIPFIFNWPHHVNRD